MSSTKLTPYKRPITYSKRRSRNTRSSPEVNQSSTMSDTKSDVIEVLSDTDDGGQVEIIAVKKSIPLEVVDLRVKLTKALEELNTAKKKIERFEAAREEENSCDVCTLPMWQPCILPCGHAMCADCLYEYVYRRKINGLAIHTIKCGYCRKRITRAPYISYDWQRRVDAMASDLGITIPERAQFQWPPPPGPPKTNRPGLV